MKMKFKTLLALALFTASAAQVTTVVPIAPIAQVAHAETVVRTLSRNIAVKPTITAGAYSANDAVGGMMTFANAVASLKTGVIATVKVIDEAEQSANLKLICFQASFTATADNAALNISDADAANIVAVVDIPAANYVDIGGSSVAVVPNVGQLFTIVSGNSLYCQLQTLGTPTYAATDDITVVIGVLQD